MKLLVATDTFYPKVDGVVTSILNSSEMLAKRDNKILILAPQYSDYEKKRIENVSEFRIKSFKFPTYKDARVALPHIKPIFDRIKKFRPDIIHIHTPGTIGALSLIYGKRNNIPVINTYHTSLPDVAMYISPLRLLNLNNIMSDRSRDTELFSKIEKNIEKIKERFENIIPKGEPLSTKAIWAASNVFYNRSDLIIVPSARIKKELIEHNIKVPIKIISNGIELDRFYPKRNYGKGMRLLHVGRLGFEKRVDVVIEALAIVVRGNPEATLCIVGDGPAAENLKSLAKKRGLEKNISFRGYIKRDELPDIYRAHDIFVTASEMETQGLVILEAMACGLPVIGVRVLAIPDLVQDNKNGYLVEKRDMKTMAEKIDGIIEQPELIKRFGEASRQEARKHNIEDSVRSLCKIYSSFCEQVN